MVDGGHAVVKVHGEALQTLLAGAVMVFAQISLSESAPGASFGVAMLLV